MENNKSISKNSFFYLLYSVLNVAFPFITGIYVARILLPNSIGQVEAARNLAEYFAIFSFLGIPTYALREIPKVRDDKNKLNELYSELMIINSISTIVFCALYLMVVFLIPGYFSEWPLYLISGGSIALNFLNNTWLYEGLEEFKFISFRNLLFKVISFILLVIFVRGKEDYLWYAAITVIGIAGNYFLNVAFSRKFVKITFKNLNLSRHLKPIVFLVVVNLAIEIYSLVDVTMLKWMSTDENVAFYSYGSKVYKILLQIINSVTYVIVPRLSILYKSEKYDEFNALLSKTLKVILLLSIPMIIGIWFTADFLMTFIYGNEYIASANVLKILCIILLFSPIGYLLGSRTLLTTGHENKMIIAVGTGSMVNVVLNAILIFKFEEVGAAIASVISELVVMVIYILMGSKYFKINNMVKDVLKILGAAGFMALYLIGVVFIPFPMEFIKIIVEIIGSIIVYFLLLALFKEEIIHLVLNRLRRKHNE